MASSKDDTICPAGYICDFINETLVQPLRVYSCSQLQEDVKAEGYGDILSGILCKNGTLDEEGAKITNCPAGHYCPDPAGEPIQCRAGFYCPAKSAKEDIYSCSACEAGATAYSVNIAALVVLIVVLFVFFSVLFLALKYKSFREALNKAFKKTDISKASFRKVQKMKEILKEIDDRLGADYVCNLNSDGDIVGFNNNVLFDAIDSNKDGSISYEELDKAMALTGDQLKIFIQKMNQASGSPENCTRVSRECFVKYFFETISAASNFDPSPADTELVFESVEQSKTNISLDQLHYSSLASFLSEKQIATLLRILRTKVMESSGNDKNDGNNKVSGTKSFSRRNVAMSSFKISKEQFVSLYPQALHEMIGKIDEKRQPFDIFFEDLSLVVPVKEGEKVVVNEVSGCLKAGTMTALMGGSGAGKTSLLNALCGRAHYGVKKGSIYINGNEADIEEYTGVIGFVPQDDIVYAELTVMENFLVAGKIRLPRGTKQTYIEDLAVEVIADLGLTRVASSVVGDVTRRGVSGGEKKRVNIGLELMSKPSILFLDEPTSGLDASSAMVVMGSLADLVREQGMTVCAVIHQPRKQIYDMFDSLVLLSVGGNLVYQGKTTAANDYFKNLGYTIDAGEGEADWLIDIASGELYPTPVAVDALESLELEVKLTDESENITEALLQDGGDKGAAAATYRDRLYKAWLTHYTSLQEEDNELFSKPKPTRLPQSTPRPSFSSQVTCQLGRQIILARRNIFSKLLETILIVAATIIIALVNKPLQLNEDLEPNIPSEFYVLTSVKENPENFEAVLPFIFRHAVENAKNVFKYGSEVSIVIAVLVTLSTAKSLTDKKTEFLREAASGYSINAYYLAVMIFNTAEISIKMILASLFSYALRNTAASGWNVVVQFILLGWLSSAWGFLTPFFTSAENVVLVSAFISLFSNILLSGKTGAAIEYFDIYRQSPVNGVISGLLAPSRFFIESVSVAEFRTLEIQHGFTNYTVLDEGYDGATGTFLSVGFNSTSMGINDPFVHEESRAGWYWGVLPSILIGVALRVFAFVLLQVRNRKQMLMKPIKKDSTAQIKLLLLLILFSVFLGVSIYSFSTGSDEFALCEVEDPADLGNGDCNHENGNYNTKYCKFDNGDCLLYNDITMRYPNCDEDYFITMGDGECQTKYVFGTNTEECGWEDGDCIHPDYPDCLGYYYTSYYNDSSCDAYYILNTEMCNWEGGDCDEENSELWKIYPDCKGGVRPREVGNGYCQNGAYNTEECGFDGGDCIEFNKLPNCTVEYPPGVGNGACYGLYNTEGCGYDGGDCVEENSELWKIYPDCKGGVRPREVGDGYCQNGAYNTEECGYDGGDCIEFNKLPNCTVEYPSEVGNGQCNTRYNTEGCGYDGGDCDEFNQLYPNCKVQNPSEVGDGECYNFLDYNTEECGYDGGDCNWFNKMYPDCAVVYPRSMNNSECDNFGYYNTQECGWDGGDCNWFNEMYPYCQATTASSIGDGYCHNYYPYFTEACGWDGGDCIP